MKVEEVREKTEAEFFDREYGAFTGGSLKINQTMINKYLYPRSKPIDWREWSAVLMGDLHNKAVLDYGCGSGEETIYFAKLGAKVHAIDISPTGVKIALERAKKHGLEHRVLAKVMDAMKMEFASETFDVIHGIGILHHLNIEEAIGEVHRVLKHGGKAIFLEPVNNSALMIKLKSIMPIKKMEVTEFEKQLVITDIELIGKKFSECRYWNFFLFARFRKLIRNQRIVDYLKRIDCFLFTYFKFFRQYGSGVVIELIK